MAPGKASSLKSSGIAPIAAFGAPLEVAVAVTETGQVGMPTMEAKLLRWGLVTPTMTWA